MPNSLRGLVGLLVLALLLVAGYVGLTLASRELTAHLRAWAGTRGLSLQIDGHPGWSLLPTPGLLLGRTRIDTTATTPAFGFEASSLRLRWQPLLGAELRIAEPLLRGINLEQSFCALAATGAATEPLRDWPQQSRLDAISGRFRLDGRKLLLDSLTTATGNLHLHAMGALDIDTRHFELRARIRLAGERTSPAGCRVEDSRLRERDLPLRCVGSLSAQPQAWCVPEGELVALLAQRIEPPPDGRESDASGPAATGSAAPPARPSTNGR